MWRALSVSSGFVRIAGEQRDLVALRVAKIANIELRAITGPKARWALVRPTGGKRGGVKLTNLLLMARLECDHATVASRSRTSIEGRFDLEIGQNGRLPRFDGQCITQSRRPLLQFVTKGWQEGGIKPSCARDVIRTDCDIGNHAAAIMLRVSFRKSGHSGEIVALL